jgi:FkbM family methyltransferase
MKKILRASVNFLPHEIRTWIKYMPGVAALQRWLVRHIISGEPFLHTLNAGPAAGLLFEVKLPLDKAVWAGTYELEFAAAIAREVRRGDVCYDIGGYRGYMTGVMALAGASKVIVFEPLPANQQALRRLCELNPGLPIEVVPVAIGNIDGSIRLRVMADTSMGKLVSSSFQAEAASIGEMEVDIQRIDTQVERGKIPRPNLIKIDVEGAELEVLQGASGVMRSFRPLIFLEAHSAMLEKSCVQMLLDLDYEICRLGSNPDSDEQTRHLFACPFRKPFQ